MKSKTLSHKQKLDALRKEMRKAGLDGFLVPRMDRYQGEFVSSGAERLAWLTGFTGSAGTAVILADRAAIFSDGRYTIQLARQADKKLYDVYDSAKKTPGQWLREQAGKSAVIGYDPWLHTPRSVMALQGLLAEGTKLVPAARNLLDAVWTDRPGLPSAKAEIFPVKIAGVAGAKKIERIAKTLQDKGLLAAVIALPDSMMWLLNVRGCDIESTPVALSMGIVGADGAVQWFIDHKKITPGLRGHVGNAVSILEPEALEKCIEDLAALAKKKKLPIALDFARAPVWFKHKLEAAGAELTDFKDPCILPKAMKTRSEQESIRRAHVTDGVAMVKFLAWLEEKAGKIKLTEMSVSEKLESFRREDESYSAPSFPTIAGFAANGAVVHYRAGPETDRAIRAPGLLLLDSGGQYRYGTTDITRTIAIGKPSGDMKRHYTLVLKGHIALARARFPEGTTGAQLDTLARQPLWAEKLDYAHGTGHGVGCYLSVHEEGASISARGHEPLAPGMLISNEPGYYREGHYGIRIENLVLVKDAGKAPESGVKMLEFETVTLVPIDVTPVIPEMLAAEEKAWLNAYHEKVRETLSPLLGKKLRAWLAVRTRPL